jgi:hypothetical protein
MQHLLNGETDHVPCSSLISSVARMLAKMLLLGYRMAIVDAKERQSCGVSDIAK